MSHRLILLAAIFVLVLLPACGRKNTYTATEGCTDYADAANWAFYEEKGAAVDVFFIAPTTAKGTDEDPYNMVVSSEHDRGRIDGAILMQKDLYAQDANFYAPYYRQATLLVYALSAEQQEQYLAVAYADVRDAFRCYLADAGERPFILVGFSQGADMAIRLMKEFCKDSAVQKRLIATYALGWHLTEAEVAEYPYLVPARGETDTGVIVMFDAEAEGMEKTMVVPKGMKTYSINPLNWKTDGTPADKSLNLGARFMKTDGTFREEVPALTGCYINTDRGTLVCPEINPDDYANPNFSRGEYHQYDYQFFYRNLQENVKKRTEAYFGQ